MQKDDYTVEELSSLIPDFRKKCATIYRKLKFFSEQRLVIRGGYSALGFYGSLVRSVNPPTTPFTDTDHVLLIQMFVVIFRDLFGDDIERLYGIRLHFEAIRDGLLFHEIGEIIIGDWLNDGSRDRRLKDKLELKIFRDFLKGFPDESKTEYEKMFLRLQSESDIQKLFDFSAFLIGQGILRHYGLEGSLEFKRSINGLGERDVKSFSVSHSDLPLPNVFLHFLEFSKRILFRSFFIGIVEEMIRIEYGITEIPSYLKDNY